MIDVVKYREEGYLVGSLKNYSNFTDFVDLKNKIDNENIKRFSKYDYWYKYKNLSYMEEVVYETFLQRDKNLKIADYIYEKSHEYMIKKMEDCEFYPTWVFGTALNTEIENVLNGDVIRNFQFNFVKEYYSDKQYKSYVKSTRLQFYDRGCEIKLHDDGKPQDRICVFLYFLNNDWDETNGGHLLLHTKTNEIVKVKPVFPNFVVLDSDVNLFHEVEKVNKDMKYNIVSFYTGVY